MHASAETAWRSPTSSPAEIDRASCTGSSVSAPPPLRSTSTARPQKLREKHYSVDGKLIGESEHVEMVDFQEYVPPNVTATIFWLKNRLPDLWRDKTIAELGGKVEHIDRLPEEDKKLMQRVVERLESYRGEGAES